MSSYTLILCMPLTAALLWAATQDLHSRRIPNWLTFSLVLCGLIQSFTPGGTVTPTQALLGLLVGFALPFVMFAIGALGGGDVKLFAGVGSWLGPTLAFEVFLIAALVGLVIVLTQSAIQGRIRTLFRNSTVLAINLAHLNDVGVDHVSQTGQASKTVDHPLPYAVPILIATVIVLLAAWMGGR